MDRRGRILVNMILNNEQSEMNTANETECDAPSPCPEILDKDPAVMAQLLEDLNDGDNTVNEIVSSPPKALDLTTSTNLTGTEWHLTDSVMAKYLDEPLDSLPSPLSSLLPSMKSSEVHESPDNILVVVGSVSNSISVENEDDFSPASDDDPSYNPLVDMDSQDSSDCDEFDETLLPISQSLSDEETRVTILDESTGILCTVSRTVNDAIAPEIEENLPENEETLCENNKERFDVLNSSSVETTQNFTPTSTNNNETEPRESLGRPKRGRKRTHPESDRFLNKINRNSNCKYYDYKNKIIEPKVFVNVKCKCKNKCHEKISAVTRRKEFERFWDLASYDAQNAYILSKIQQALTKRMKKDTEINGGQMSQQPKKQYVRTYVLDNKSVCKTYFLKTYQISSCRVNTTLKKSSSDAAFKCQRGFKQGGVNKTKEDKINGVIEFIKRIPTYESHYCRTKTEAKFLPPEMTLAKLIDIYKEEFKEAAVSAAVFKKIFYSKFNLRTAPLKKDTCNYCDSIKAKIENERSESKKEELKKQHEDHLKLADEAQNQLKDDIKLAQECCDVECITFDMEKTLPLPRISTNVVFYKRQLWLYNEGVYSGKGDKGFCYIWVEGEAGKGAQEVGSVLRRHVKEELPPNTKHLILWSDSCGGQNRNIKITLILKTLLEEIPSLEKITMRFLLSGHSFLPNDRHFATIESALKHVQRLYLPEDYVSIMKNAKKKKPLTVKRMEKPDFLSTELLENHVTNRKLGVNKEKVCVCLQKLLK